MQMRAAGGVICGFIFSLAVSVIPDGALAETMTMDDQIGASMLALGLAAGAAMACKLPDRADQDAAKSFLSTVPDGARHKKFSDAYITGLGSAMGAIERDKNFPAICQNSVPEMITKSDQAREFLMRQTR